MKESPIKQNKELEDISMHTYIPNVINDNILKDVMLYST